MKQKIRSEKIQKCTELPLGTLAKLLLKLKKV